MVAAKKSTGVGKKVAKSAPAVEPEPPTPTPAPVEPGAIPDGKPKSGRVWKTKQHARFSTVNRSGMMSFLCKSREKKDAERSAHQQMKELEREMKEERKNKVAEEKRRREEQKQRRQANEYKNSVYQVIKPETMKGMSKKQLRMVRKTAVNKAGQVELVPAFGSSAGQSNAVPSKKRR